ncbi:hypothetical protein BC567DRAFT_238104 [Phyllosticta citribraziliensis]
MVIPVPSQLIRWVFGLGRVWQGDGRQAVRQLTLATRSWTNATVMFHHDGSAGARRRSS